MSQVKVQGGVSGTGSVTILSPNTNSDYTATLPAGTGTFAVQGVSTNIVSGTAVASTSGTSIDFTSIPSWVKRITVMFSGVSTNGTSALQIQIGTSGGFQTTSYASTAWDGTATTITSGFSVNRASATAAVQSGVFTIQLLDFSTGNWAYQGSLARTDAANQTVSAGSKSLSGTLDRVRITTVNGTDTFDAGSINILYE